MTRLTRALRRPRACPCACAPRAYWCAEKFPIAATCRSSCVRVRAACVLVCRKISHRGHVPDGLHLPSVGSSILLVSVVTQVTHGRLTWLLVGFTATST